MILADTSVWIDHLRGDNSDFSNYLLDGKIFTHPFVVGELSLGSLRNRRLFINQLSELPQATEARDEEVMELIEWNHLFGKGIGFVDAHLLASARISNLKLWTNDKTLKHAATILDVAH